MLLSCFLLFLRFYIADGHYDPLEYRNKTIESEHESRRILNGKKIDDTRPYMVYLRPAKPQSDPNWLCGGVIIHPRYILTSAACIEDVMHFFIVSGTHTWVPQSETNDCIKNGAIKAIWKCVPKIYRFDGSYYNNINWMANDIAVVMTAEPFNFEKRVRGCDFVPQAIAFNNDTAELESEGRKGSVAGWGSIEQYYDPADLPSPAEDDKKPPARIAVNSPQLMEAEVEVMSKDTCKSLWHERYHKIIDENMICGKNIIQDEMQQACEENQMACRELVFSAEAGGTLRRHHKDNLEKRLLQSLQKAKNMRRTRHKSLRREGKELGGFCENDHGGPLIAGQGKTAVLIGIMSAYRTMNHSTRCVGPFLYTSVYNSRNLINCAINRELGPKCRTVLRSSSTVLDQEDLRWGDFKKGILRSYKRKRHNKAKSRHDKPHHDKPYHDKPHKTDTHSRYLNMKLVNNLNEKVFEKRDESTSTTTESVSKEDEGLSIAFKVRRHDPPRRVRVLRRSIPPSPTRKSLKSKN